MFQLAGIDPECESRNVIQRSGSEFVTFAEAAPLRDMQTARASKCHRRTVLYTDSLIALFVFVAQLSIERLQHVRNTALKILPSVGHGVFQIQHHPRRSG